MAKSELSMEQVREKVQLLRDTHTRAALTSFILLRCLFADNNQIQRMTSHTGYGVGYGYKSVNSYGNGKGQGQTSSSSNDYDYANGNVRTLDRCLSLIVEGL
jgi:hypothetical protein